MQLKVSFLFLTGCCAVWSTSNFAHAEGVGPSEVSMYGIVDTYVGSTKTSGDSSSKVGVGNGGFTTSFWGIRGTENLGGGYAAVFALESYFQPQNGQAGRSATDAFFSRSAYVGFIGPFGTVTAGQQISPFFKMQALFNPFGGSTTLNPLIVQSYRAPYGRAMAGDDLVSNAVVYSSPTVNGLSGTLTYVFGNVAGQAGQNNLIATGLYQHGGFAATIAAERLKVETYPSSPSANLGPASNQVVVNVGLSYDLSVAKGFLEYQRTNNGSIPRKDNILQVGGSVKLDPANWILVSWARDTVTGDSPRQTRDTASAGYQYLLSKRTDVYISYQYDKAETQATANSFIAGMRHRF
ncbi:porin [Paraburkholderia sp. 22B1P]|uniref:porin n=1 Tax=Paraburkholderia sp. 22B1P TaxID=3080498 RepID=UPI00308BB5F4|nr:porin [Paraburkholderia sp. 22B1P]